MRVLIVSWEYPPIVEGGLARHVSRLAEELVRRGVAVDVLTRGRDGEATEEVRAGVVVHRVAAPPTPRDLDVFLDWVDALNARMVAVGVALAPGGAFAVVHGWTPVGLGLAVAGCSDDAPGAGTADMGASRVAAKDKHGGLTNFGTRGGDVAPVKTRGKGTGGRPAGPNADAQGQKR